VPGEHAGLAGRAATVKKSPLAIGEALPAAVRPLVERLLAEAERRGRAVHLVGGPVRDFLLQRPVRDVDLVVEPEGEDGAAELARAAAPPEARVVVHERFGTVRIEVDGAALDVATARAEGYARPGALPLVRTGTLEDDLRRRDFTVNALAAPLTTAARRGRPAVIDLATGIADLEAGLLRVFHPRSFHDDPTRALRAARLAPRLGFRIARSTGTALRGALRDGAFGGVSGERFRAELAKLFADAPLGLDPSAALRWLADWHVLGALEPGLTLPADARAPLRRLGRAVAEAPWPEPRFRPLGAGLMLWLAPVERGLRRRALHRLAVQGANAEAVERFPETRDGVLDGLAEQHGRGACDALLAGLAPDARMAVFASAEPATRRRLVRWAREDRAVVVPVTGEDLVGLGLRGPAVGAVLAQLRVFWLDRAVRDREELLALAVELSRQAPPARRPRRAHK
jgi:tRNA nucleotidyltransferase (CCA-adding enzyme)